LGLDFFNIVIPEINASRLSLQEKECNSERTTRHSVVGTKPEVKNLDF